ncbi:Sas10 [Gracilaria domingensis]|nr:Sas10 [Gracilaria domingensis]
MGKKSNRPLLKGRLPSEAHGDASRGDQTEMNGNDDVDEFFEDRHQTLLKGVGSDDSEAEEELEPELIGTEIMKVESSESEDSENSDEEDGDIPSHPEEDKRGWGARRKDWYGGDTNEFEIMEDDERDEALRDEEEEALRMQKKALEELNPEDFRDEDDSDTEPEKEESEDGKKQGVHPGASEEVVADVMDVAAPEVPALVKEMIQSHKAAQALQEKSRSNETLRVMYHLHASLVTNVAYYLSLRTHPETQGFVDVRTHPVLLRIMSLRKLLQRSSQFSIPEELDNEEEDMAAESPATRKESLEKSEKDSGAEHGIEDGASVNDKDGKEPATEEAHGDKMNGVLSKAKKKSRRRRGKKRKRTEVTIEEDEEKIQELLKTKHSEQPPDTESSGKRARKKKKIRGIVNVMESQRKNEEGKRFAPTDEDLVRPVEKKTQSSSVDCAQSVGELDTAKHDEDDDEVMQKMLAKKAKKEARKERKAAAAQPHVYRFNDLTTPDGKRKASSQVVKNKGLTRYRPRNKKTPRAKNRLAYANAVKRRKGAVREYAGKPGGGYSGEASGINMSARKGSKLSEV